MFISRGVFIMAYDEEAAEKVQQPLCDMIV